MKSKHFQKINHRFLVVFFSGCISITNFLFAQSSVIGLRFNNQNVTTAKVNVMSPGKGGNRTELKSGETLASGTRLIIPPNTIVLLQSPQGKQKLQSLTGKSMEYTVDISAKGENHTVKGHGASVQNTVNKIVGHDYKANNGRGSIASSRGTVYTFTDYSQEGNEQAKVNTEEGSITITDAVPVKVKGIENDEKKNAREITQSVSKIQSAGDAEFTTTDKYIEFESAEQAIQAVSKGINLDEIDEETADDLTCLGDLYMENEQPEKAIQPYRNALKFYNEEYGEDDLTTLEIQLALADALTSVEDHKMQTEGNTLAAEAISILEELLEISREDLNYVKAENDVEAEELICDDIIDIYILLGYGYDIAGNEAKSNMYYDKSDQGCE